MPGCVTSVFQPGTNLKHVELHGREVGTRIACLLPKRIMSGVFELLNYCSDLKENIHLYKR